MGESSAPRRPTHDTNTSPRIRNEVKITQTQTYKYTLKITGLIASTMLLLMASAPSGLLASPDGQPSIVPVEEIELPLSDGLSAGIGLRQDVVTTRGRKLALIPLADLADIGLGVQKIFNPAIGQVNSNDVRGLANTLQKYLPFPFLATGDRDQGEEDPAGNPLEGNPLEGNPLDARQPREEVEKERKDAESLNH